MRTPWAIRRSPKTFTLHQQNGVVLNVLRGVEFSVKGGECLVLHGQSGAGKSTLLRTLYGNYLPAGGAVVEDADQGRASSLGFVHQFQHHLAVAVVEGRSGFVQQHHRLPAGGSIRVQHLGEWLELVGAEPREVLQVRQQTLGYVSQFLRVIP